MKRRFLFLGLLLSCILPLLTGCGKGSSVQDKERPISHPRELNSKGMVIGVPQGAAAMTVAEKYYDQAEIKYYGALTDGYTAVEQKKIDAFIFDQHNIDYVVSVNPSLARLPGTIGEEHIVVGIAPGKEKLQEEVNRFIARYRKDGTYQKMYRRWVEEKNPKMPEIPVPAHPVRTLRVGSEGFNIPMNYFGENGELTGFDVEFIRRLALELNADVKLSSMSFDGLVAAVGAGKIDLLVANLNGTPERRESMLMSDDYLDSAICAMVHRDRLAKPTPSADTITSVKDLKGKKVAYLTGSIFQQVTEKLVDGAKYFAYNDYNLVVQAVRSRKADVLLTDEPLAKFFVSQFPDDLQLACVYEKDIYGFACRKGSPLRDRVSAVIRELKQTGELDKMIAKWCSGPIAEKVVPHWTHRKSFSGKNGKLRFAADAVLEPMCYMGKEGKYIGLEIELISRIAYELDMTFEFIPMNFGALIESLIAEKADIVGGSMSITEERKEKVDFSESHYIGGMTIVMQKPRAPVSRGNAPITDFSQLFGKRIGILSGTTMDRLAQQYLPSSKPVYYDSFTDMPIALKAEKIDGFLIEEPQARLLVRQWPDLRILTKRLTSVEYAFLFPFQGETLRDAFNRELRTMEKDGTLKRLDKKWFSGDATLQEMPTFPAKPTKGILRFATVPQLEPFTFLRNGQIVGYDIEVAQRIAQKLGYGLEPVVVNWQGLLPMVSSGKVHFGASCATITEERKQKVLFSVPNYRGGVVVMVSTASKGKSQGGFGERCVKFLKELRASFDRTFVRENRWKLVLEGLQVTVIITVLSALLGTLLAFGVCMMRRSKRGWLSRFAKGYIALMQGTPILVILMLLYYVVFAKIDINAILVAVIGFSLNFAAYVGEMFRTGIGSIPRGQTEAALALGFTRFAAFRKVILPQVLLQILPVYKGGFVSMLKMTSIVGYIAIQDLTKMSDIIRSRTYEAFFPLIVTALIYFLVAHLLAYGLTWLEIRFDPKARRAGKKGGVN